jgi:hypothetical protein
VNLIACLILKVAWNLLRKKKARSKNAKKIRTNVFRNAPIGPRGQKDFLKV